MCFGRGKYWSMFFLILYFTTMTILSTETLQSKNQFTSNSLSWNILSCSYHVSLHSASTVSVQPLCKAHSDSWLSSFPWSPWILSVCSTSFNNQVWAFACFPNVSLVFSMRLWLTSVKETFLIFLELVSIWVCISITSDTQMTPPLWQKVKN